MHRETACQLTVTGGMDGQMKFVMFLSEEYVTKICGYTEAVPIRFDSDIPIQLCISPHIQGDRSLGLSHVLGSSTVVLTPSMLVNTRACIYNLVILFVSNPIFWMHCSNEILNIMHSSGIRFDRL